MQALTYDDRTHTYKLYGIVVPSVTQVLRLAGCGYQMFTDVTQQAEFGTNLHKILEHIDNGESVKYDAFVYDAHVQTYLEFLKKGKAVMLMTELLMHSDAYRFAGRADNIACINGEYGILDKKSSLNEQPTYSLQTVGYDMLAKEMGIDKALGVELTKRWTLYIGDKRYKLVEHKDKNDARTFASCLQVAHWKMAHKMT